MKKEKKENVNMLATAIAISNFAAFHRNKWEEHVPWPPEGLSLWQATEKKCENVVRGREDKKQADERRGRKETK